MTKRRRRNIGVSPVARRALPAHSVLLLLQLRALQLPPPQPEFRFHETRRWRFDFAWPAQRLALEIEGGVYVAGRHSRGAGMEGDMEKYAEALVAGWRVLRVTPRMVRDGRAAAWVGRALDPLP